MTSHLISSPCVMVSSPLSFPHIQSHLHEQTDRHGNVESEKLRRQWPKEAKSWEQTDGGMSAYEALGVEGKCSRLIIPQPSGSFFGSFTEKGNENLAKRWLDGEITLANGWFGEADG